MTFLVKYYPRQLNSQDKDDFIPVSRIRSAKAVMTMQGAPSVEAAKQQIVRELHAKGMFVKKIELQEQTQ